MAHERFEDIVPPESAITPLTPIEQEVLWHNDVLALQEDTLGDAGTLEKAYRMLEANDEHDMELGFKIALPAEQIRDNPLAKIGLQKETWYKGEEGEYERVAVKFTLYEANGKGSRNTEGRVVPIAARIGNVVVPYSGFTFEDASLVDGLARYTESGKDKHAPHVYEDLYSVARTDARMTKLPKVESRHVLPIHHWSPNTQD